MSSFPPSGGPLKEENGRATRSKDSKNATVGRGTSKERVSPTLEGVFIDSTLDAYIIIQACIDGKLPSLPRRPSETENTDLIVKSGCVVVYEESASTIKRWTDAKTWSPSRLVGNFLVYRETEPETEDLLPGQKRKARKANRVSNNRIAKPGAMPDQAQRRLSGAMVDEEERRMLGGMSDEEIRRLLGSLVGISYGFKPQGLMKKTLTVAIDVIEPLPDKKVFHLVNYYYWGDAREGGSLKRPLSMPDLWGKLDASFARKDCRHPVLPEMLADNHPGMNVYFQEGLLTGFESQQVPITSYDDGTVPGYYGAQYPQQQYTTPHHSQAPQMGAYPSPYASAYPSAHQQYDDFHSYVPHPALQYGPAPQMQLAYSHMVDRTHWVASAPAPAVHYDGLDTMKLEAKEESP
ncbi:Gti1/Pac2 family domain containing protein [Rhypophila decipiens]